MAKTDKELGERIHQKLAKANIESPMLEVDRSIDTVGVIQGFMADTMTMMGLDLQDDSLRGTPKRIAKMYCEEVFTGLDYRNFPECSTFLKKVDVDEMVAVTGISVKSMCEHHFLPFIGTACVGYLPNEYILGLSKFNRVVDFFSRRPQVQERLVNQIGLALQEILGTDDVAVVIRAEHYCVKLRGVQDGGNTTTSYMSGKFRTVPELRAEFLTLAR
jgi:GTP cyclohydrolase I